LLRSAQPLAVEAVEAALLAFAAPASSRFAAFDRAVAAAARRDRVPDNRGFQNSDISRASHPETQILAA